MTRRFRPAVAPLEDRTVPSGGLDPTFGTGGILPLTPAEQPEPIAVLPDGRTYTAAGGTTSVTVTRRAADGQLDPTFGAGGQAVIDITNLGISAALADVLVQPDGRVVLAGAIDTGDNFDFFAARVNPDGTPDATFSGDGLAAVGFDIVPVGADFGEAVALQPDGKIVVAGRVRFPDPVTPALGVIRLNPDGTPDPTFDGDGRALNQLETNTLAAVGGVFVDGAGRVTAVGTVQGTFGTPATESRAVAARFTPTGGRDNTLDGDAVLIVDFDPGAPFLTGLPARGALVPGRFLLGSPTANGSVVARFTDTGAPDPAFGGAPLAGVELRDLVVQPDGRVVVVGGTSAGDVAVARLRATGQPDPTFVRPPIDLGGFNAGRSVGLLADGRIVVGADQVSSDPFLLRLIGNDPPVGVPDPSFSIGQDRPLTAPAPGVLGNDTDPDGPGPLVVTRFTQPPAAEGTVTVAPDGGFVFTPAPRFVGPTGFTYFVGDGLAESGPVNVTITVTPAVPPTGTPDAYTVGQNRPLTVAGPGVLGNDAANDIFGPLTVSRFTQPPAAEGTVAVSSDGSFTFTPVAGFVGPTGFSYFVSDGITTTGPVAVAVTVTPAVPPTANADAFDLGRNRALTIAAPGVLANDAANDIFGPLRAVLVAGPDATDGSLTLNADGSFTFTAAASFDGTATFRYAATDGVTTGGPAAVTITGSGATRLYAFGAGAGGGPRVRVFASDGTPRFDFFAFEASFVGGVRVAVGDVTGDRTDDIVVAAGPGGGPRVSVFDGVTGGRVFDLMAYEPGFSQGVHLAVADLDADGFADIVTGTGSGGGPRVRAFAGRTGAELANFFPYDSRFRGGVRVGAGDLDGDGRAEIVTAAGPSGGPDIGVFTAAGAQVARFFGFDPGYRGGAFVSVGRSPRGSARLFLSPDSSPDYTGSLLGDQFSTLNDTAGGTAGVPASNARLVTPPRVYVFAPADGGRSFQQVAAADVLSPALTGGTRVAGGAFGPDLGVFVGSGPGGGGRVQFLPLLRDGGLGAPTLDAAAFDPGFLDSVYVGAGSSR